MSEYALLLFPSTHDAICAEKRLRGDFPVTMMPVPRQLSASCGLCLRFPAIMAGAVRAALQDAPVSYELALPDAAGASG